MQYWGQTIRIFCVVCLLAVTVASASPDLEENSSRGDRRWKVSSIRLSLSRSLLSGSAQIRNGSNITSVVSAAAGVWEEAAAVKFLLGGSPRESVSGARGTGDGTNLITIAATPENLALFPEQHRSSPAYTRLFFNRSGSIIEADVVLNPYVSFSTDGTPETYDLQAVITHELGHVLGLKHSPAMSATMYERISLNRENSQRGLDARTLSSADISSVRAIYGPGSTFADCCVTVMGPLAANSSSRAILWVEESVTGRLIAGEGLTGARFSIGGFDAGNYRLLIQGEGAGRSVEIMEGFLDLPIQAKQVNLGTAMGQPDIRLIGLNGELGSAPVTLEKGRTHQIFVGGSGLDPASVTLGFSGGSISVVEGSVFSIDYGRDLTALALSVTVSQQAPDGDYSLYVEGPTGARRYLIGSVSVH